MGGLLHGSESLVNCFKHISAQLQSLFVLFYRGPMLVYYLHIKEQLQCQSVLILLLRVCVCSKRS